MRKMFEEFKRFISRGNVMDLAVGVMIGGAFGKIVTSLVSDMIMPLIGIVLGGLNLSGAFIALDGNAYATLEAATAAGAGTLNYGSFLQSVIDFLIIAVCVFLFTKGVNRLMPKKPAEQVKKPRLCPFCQTEIPEKATRCPHCTSELDMIKEDAR